jgi:hypothetical protein
MTLRHAVLLALSLYHAVTVTAFSPTLPTVAKSVSSSSLLLALSDDELISLTKEYLDKPSPDFWADDFVFRGPVIGPLAKKDLVDTLTTLDPSQSFSDFEPNAFGFSVDPVEPNRVWYFVRPRGRFTKAYNHPVFGNVEATNEELIAPPEARSVIWKDDKTIRYQSVGYVMDRYTGDTTNGMGAVFGLFHHMGITSMDDGIGSVTNRFLQWLSSRVLPEGMLPKSYSKEEDIPAWWTDKRRGADK